MEQKNANTLNKELDWMERIIAFRFNSYFEGTKKENLTPELIPPKIENDSSVFAKFISHYELAPIERLAIILVLSPHLRPEALDCFFKKNKKYSRGFTEFGGIAGKQHSGFIPTAETLVFISGGSDLFSRLQVMKLFHADHLFAKHNILKLNSAAPNEPILSGTMELSQELFELYTFGESTKPTFNSDFPAKLINTNLEWSDFVADQEVFRCINDILLWTKHNKKILGDWEMGDVVKPGYKALFHGPSGTGKTFAASLIGKQTGKDVYKIDLSMVVSKWVGETEKNLAKIFDMAENKDWILFFDEADSLFGKRTNTNSSQERYANQEVSYLLQRTESFPGTIILASNLKSNMDKAFMRRFQSIIYFAPPKIKQRKMIWDNYFSKSLKISPKVDLAEIAKKHEITGGSIVNVLKYCAIHAAESGVNSVDNDMLMAGIRNERMKEGKVV